MFFFFSDEFKQFLDETFDVKAHANKAIQGKEISEQLSKLAEGISLLDKEIHSQVFYCSKPAFFMQSESFFV